MQLTTSAMIKQSPLSALHSEQGLFNNCSKNVRATSARGREGRPLGACLQGRHNHPEPYGKRIASLDLQSLILSGKRGAVQRHPIPDVVTLTLDVGAKVGAAKLGFKSAHEHPRIRLPIQRK